MITAYFIKTPPLFVPLKGWLHAFGHMELVKQALGLILRKIYNVYQLKTILSSMITKVAFFLFLMPQEVINHISNVKRPWLLKMC